MTKQHINHISEEFLSKKTYACITEALGTAAGSEKLYVNIDRIPPGCHSTKYHSHSQQEEFFCDFPAQVGASAYDYVQGANAFFTDLIQDFTALMDADPAQDFMDFEQAAQAVGLAFLLRIQPQLVVDGFDHEGR